MTNSPNTPRPSRWRFSIRQLCIAVGLFAIALAAYRELPDLYRRRFLNDPIPLHVSDKSKIHVRQIPYHASQQFTYRIYTPPSDTPHPKMSDQYFVYAGETKEEGVFPTEYKACPLANNEWNLPGAIAHEHIITGLMIHEDPQAKTRRLNVTVRSGPSSPLPINVVIDPGDMHCSTYSQKIGIDKTVAFEKDEKIILFRLRWNSNSSPSDFNYDLDAPGRGIIVWIQRGSPKETKPSASP